MVFSRKGMGIGQPGNVYEFDAIEKGDSFSIYPKSKHYLGHWPDKEVSLKWECENRAYINERDARTLEKNEATKSLLKETLAPLRERYEKLPYPKRQAFLAAILYHIVN